MRLAVAAIALVACEHPHALAPIAGERPIECGPPPSSGGADNEDFQPHSGPATAIHLPLPLFDPDCTSATTHDVHTHVVLVWRDGSIDRVSSVPATRRSTWTLDGDHCRARITIEHGGELVGRPGTIQPCSTDLVTHGAASFAEVPVLLGALSIDGAVVAVAGPLPWTETPADRPCDLPPIERSALAVALVADVSLPLADWQRLHAAESPVLTVRAAIHVH